MEKLLMSVREVKNVKRMRAEKRRLPLSLFFKYAVYRYLIENVNCSNTQKIIEFAKKNCVGSEWVSDYELHNSENIIEKWKKYFLDRQVGLARNLFGHGRDIEYTGKKFDWQKLALASERTFIKDRCLHTCKLDGSHWSDKLASIDKFRQLLREKV